MLKSLYIAKSRIRRDVLALFFTSPFKKYYLRELQRILKYSAGSIRRELLKFKEDSLFNTEKVGNLLYYSINTKHPLFKEIKSIVDKTAGVEAQLKDELLSIGKIKLAFIYGSFASGKEKPDSDIDLFIVGNPNVLNLNEKIMKLESKLKREINSTVYSLEEYSSKKKRKAGFIMDLIKKPKIVLIGNKNEIY
ncbi:MAG: nucleotidyltransferase domain-containing protein [Candidatus Aureabacteria bacterium]|nr:nucleotidyltransferase domain-containing protein [Candidatus Auribacterota bacterium]